MQHQQGIWLSNCQCKYPAVVVHEVCPEQESHEEETHRELPSEADEKQMISLKLDPFTTTQAVAKKLNVDHSMVLRHSEAKLEKWKSLQCGHLMSWPKFFLKNCPFELLSSLMLYNSNAQFLDGIVTCSEKWNNELCIMSGVVQWLTWEDSPKHFPKPNLHQKRSWSQFSDLPQVWFSTAFEPGRNHYVWTMLSKLMRDTPNCNSHSSHCSTERVLFFRTMPKNMSYNQCFKSRVSWFMNICLLTLCQPLSLQASWQLFFFRDNTSSTF